MKFYYTNLNIIKQKLTKIIQPLKKSYLKFKIPYQIELFLVYLSTYFIAYSELAFYSIMDEPHKYVRYILEFFQFFSNGIYNNLLFYCILKKNFFHFNSKLRFHLIFTFYLSLIYKMVIVYIRVCFDNKDITLLSEQTFYMLEGSHDAYNTSFYMFCVFLFYIYACFVIGKCPLLYPKNIQMFLEDAGHRVKYRFIKKKSPKNNF